MQPPVKLTLQLLLLSPASSRLRSRAATPLCLLLCRRRRARQRARLPQAAAAASHGARDHREPPPLHHGIAGGHARARAVPGHRRAHARLAAALPGRHQHTVRGPRADLQCSSVCDVLGVHSSYWRSHPGVLDDPDGPPDAEDGAHDDPPGGPHPGHLRRVRGVQVPRRGRGAGPDEPPLVAGHHRHRALRPAVALRLRHLLAARGARAHPRRGGPRARHGRAGHLHAGRVRGPDGARGEERRRRLRRRDEAHQRHGHLHRPLRGRRRIRRRAAQGVSVGVCLAGRSVWIGVSPLM